MKTLASYRQGPVGALLDEYERAMDDLRSVVTAVSMREFETIADARTEDPDCRSIQTIVHHVVRSGYGYADYLREWLGMLSERPEIPMPTHKSFDRDLKGMLAYTEQTFAEQWDIDFEEAVARPIRVRWGQVYDVEQLFEHAIVHVLRHRRQIERFLLILRADNAT